MKTTAAALALLAATSAAAAIIVPGDVAITPACNAVILCPTAFSTELLSNSGVLKDTLEPHEAAAFGPDHRLYATYGKNIDAYDSSLTKTAIVTALSSSGATAGFAVAANGDFVVLRDVGPVATLYVLSPAGAVKQSFVVSYAGPAYTALGFDLAPDQCTVFYIDASYVGRRFNLCSGQQLAKIPGNEWHGVRAFADGGYLAASGGILSVFDASDDLLRTVTTQVAYASVLAFDTDPQYVWTADSTSLFKIRLADGVSVPSGGVPAVSIAVNGEQRPASADVVANIPTLSPSLLAAVAVALIALACHRLGGTA